ncbi:MAG: FHA domain-containing protein, partial [Firmicutes bacterium]|nr:FHA domain-containing protein [Bacillota bacterium]
GGSFTIGRFDVLLVYRQSDFEFGKETTEVSRHHAVIQQAADGSYSILDQNSKAGTYVGGQRITPNIPYPLSRGCAVSFGTAGADYIWEA